MKAMKSFHSIGFPFLPRTFPGHQISRALLMIKSPMWFPWGSETSSSIPLFLISIFTSLISLIKTFTSVLRPRFRMRNRLYSQGQSANCIFVVTEKLYGHIASRNRNSVTVKQWMRISSSRQKWKAVSSCPISLIAD